MRAERDSVEGALKAGNASVRVCGYPSRIQKTSAQTQTALSIAPPR